MKTNYVKFMTWQDYAKKSEDSVLIIPIGSTEQHSTHLPLGTDTIIPEYLIDEIAKQVDCVVAPTINYGYKSQPTSGGGPLFPGTIDLSGATVISLIKDIVEEFIRDGWKKIIIFSAHFENEAFISEAADLITRDQKTDFPRIILTNWWSYMDEALIDVIFDEVEFPGWELEHAAIVETSLVMHIDPDLVREDRMVDDGVEVIPPYQQFPACKTLIPATGTLHTSRSSSAAKGKLMCDNVIKNFIDSMPAMFEVE